jgi:hypothetical protein
MSDVMYDKALFQVAHKRFMLDPKALTDADIAQLAIVDPTLVDRARAKRAGYVEADDAEMQALRKKAISCAAFHEWERDYLSPILATYRHKAEQQQTRNDDLETRVRSLEGRILELEAQQVIARVDR